MPEPVPATESTSTIGEACTTGLADSHTGREPPVRSRPALTPSDHRRNFALGVLNGALFRIGDIFIDTQTVLTWFLAQLGASNTLIGFVQPLRFGASFLLQLSFSGYVERQPYKHPLYRTISIFRCLVLLAFASVVAVVPVESPWLVAAFFVALTLYSLGAGLVSIPFMDVVGKVVPPRRRGVFFGRRMFWGGLVALAGSTVIGFLVAEPFGLTFPLNVAVMFVLASALMWLTAWSWLAIKEPPSPVPASPPGDPVTQLVTQLRRGVGILRRNVAYRRYAWVRLALTVSSWATPFFVVYAQRELGAAPELIGLYLGVRTGGGIVSNLIWGRISDRMGNRKLIILTTAVGTVTPVLVLVLGWLHGAVPGSASWVTYAFALVFLAAGIFGPGSGIGLINYLLDVAPEEERPLYLAFNNTLFGLARFTGALGGLIVDWLGFDVMMVVTTGCYLAALAGSFRLVDVGEGR